MAQSVSDLIFSNIMMYFGGFVLFIADCKVCLCFVLRVHDFFVFFEYLNARKITTKSENNTETELKYTITSFKMLMRFPY